MATIYTGPGKVLYDSEVIQAEGINGGITAVFNDESDPIAAAMHGHVGETVADLTATITVNPFCDWDYLNKLYPLWFGATTASGGTGLLDVGKDLTATVWKTLTIEAPSGRQVVFKRVALVKPPDMTFGVGQPLFGSATWTAIGDDAIDRNAAGFLLSAPVESGATTTDTTENADIIRERWTGALAGVTGFTAIEAETAFSLTSEIQVQSYQVQKVTRVIRLMSARYMISCRPVGPTMANLKAMLESHALGARYGYPGTVALSAVNFTLTSAPTGKTVALQNCDVKGGGFSFGGTTLGLGEVGFVNQMVFTVGVKQPLIVFS